MDTEVAYEHFAGKSLEQSVRLFEVNAIVHQEDVMFMPRACFSFYVKAYVAYLLSEASKGDSDAANCFFGLVDFRSAEIRLDSSTRSMIVHALRYLAERQDWFGAEVSIYGNFEERAQTAEEHLNLGGP